MYLEWTRGRGLGIFWRTGLVGSVFSNMACDYDIIVKVNPKFCKCRSVELCQTIF